MTTMDTTAPLEPTNEPSAEELLVRLADVDAADAPTVADDLARLLAMSLDSPADSSRQLEADFGEVAS